MNFSLVSRIGQALTPVAFSIDTYLLAYSFPLKNLFSFASKGGTDTMKKLHNRFNEKFHQIRYSLEPRWGFMSLCSGRAIRGSGDDRTKGLKPHKSLVNQLKFKHFFGPVFWAIIHLPQKKRSATE